MNYKKLKEIIKNNKNIGVERQLILFGYIDYCEKNNINISEIVKTIRESELYGDIITNNQEWFDINSFLDELELLTIKYNIIIEGTPQLKTIKCEDIYGAEGKLFWNGTGYELK